MPGTVPYCTVPVSTASGGKDSDHMTPRPRPLTGTLRPALLAGLPLAVLLTGCSRTPDPAETVDAIADEFVAGYYAQYPEDIYEVGYPDGPDDRWGDHSPQAMADFDSRLDGWADRLAAIDTGALTGTPAAITYAFVSERVQALRDMRVCRQAQWNVSPTWTGWPSEIAATLGVQAVDTEAARAAALSRAADLPRFIDTEIANLRRGLDETYLSPQSNVDMVIRQMDALLAAEPADSPLYSPAARSDDEEFVAAYRDLLVDAILPAVRRYRDFLAADYDGRDRIGVQYNPAGRECYDAAVRYWSSVDISADDIHRLGMSEMARIQTEMAAIARESFGTDDVPALLQTLRTDPKYTFASAEDMLGYVTAAVERGKAAVGDWFGFVPDAELVIVESPAFEKDSGGGFYSAGTADGSRPGTYRVGTWDPTTIARAGQEATAFHESYPGHHLQVSVAMANTDLHPVLNYMFISGSSEGYALYTERLADEMGLYSDDVARLGMLSNEALRAARLVVDTGIHVLGWSRDDAIEYMLANTASSRGSIENQVDRYAAVPGQATSYLLGSLEIQRLRREAREALGDAFDIREFHDRLLENGAVSLPVLADVIGRWVEAKRVEAKRVEAKRIEAETVEARQPGTPDR